MRGGAGGGGGQPGGGAPVAAPVSAAAPAAPQQPDYSAQWAEYYRSIGKIFVLRHSGVYSNIYVYVK